MKKYEEKLKRFIEENNLNCSQMIFASSCHSVEEAAETAGADPEDFVKNICMMDSDGNLIVAIVKGEDRASTKRVAKILGIDRPMAAKPETIEKKTGYPVGGVPSFGFDAVFLIDERVMEKELVYSGGGSPKALVKIRPEDLIASNRGTISRVRK